MIIYINNKKLDVNRLESVYVINQKMGDGSIKYKGKVLNIENNFTYYDINEGDKLDLGSLRGGGGSFFQWFLAIIILFVFLFYLFSGLITFIFDFGIQVIKMTLLNKATKLKPCQKGGPLGVNTQYSSSRYLLHKVLAVIFFIFLAYMVYISVYTFANFTSLQIFYLKKGAHGIKSVCDVQHKASRVGFWTAVFYTGIYGMARSEMLGEEMMDDLPDDFLWLKFFIKPFVKIFTKIGGFFKNNLAASIWGIGNAVRGYQEMAKAVLPNIWKIANFAKDLGDPKKADKFKCSDPEILKEIITWISDLVGPQAHGEINIKTKKALEELGLMQYFKNVLTKFKHDYYQKTNDDSFKIAYDTYEGWLTAAEADKHVPLSFLFSADVQKVDLYSLSEFVICQLIGYFNFLGRTLEDINPDASDVTDMFISGNTAGAISMIPFLISFIYYLF